MAAPIRKHILEKSWWKTKKWLANGRSLTFCRLLSERKRVCDLLREKSNIGQSLEIKGWVNSLRTHKDVVFLSVTDGSCLKPLQVVTSPENVQGIAFGSSVCAEGKLVKSPASGQPVELMANKVALIGGCVPEEYPFKVKERHPADYTRSFPHLRHRTNAFGALLRIRNAATMAIHQYFQTNGYCFVNTPVITSNDAEGAGEVFQVQPASSAVSEMIIDDEAPSKDKSPHFFGHPAYLTVSGQLQLEAVSGGLGKVYTFGPTFRAENARGRHHLCEFYMLEAEWAFTESLEEILQEMESLVKVSTCQVLDQCPHNVEVFHRHVAPGQKVLERCTHDVEVFHRHVAPGQKAVVEKILSSDWKRISYDEAVTILSKKNEEFQFKVSWGSDLMKEHEQYLVSHFNNTPVFLTNFPTELKPFYARANDDGKTVAAVDLLFPGVGEVFGGSLREERFDLLKHRLEKLQVADEYSWYLDIRRFGSAPHGGFGMGFERFLQYLLGVPNIKDIIPFPRSSRNCKM